MIDAMLKVFLGELVNLLVEPGFLLKNFIKVQVRGGADTFFGASSFFV